MVAGVLVLRRSYHQRFSQDIEQLFSAVEPVAEQSFTYDQLAGLPVPVQRYFRHVVPEGYPYIRSVRLKHDGYFKTAPGKGWTAIEGEQYFTTDPPGFIWQGTTTLFRARDQYVAHQGRLTVHLLSMLRVVDAHGPTVDQGELLRWLGESTWFPTNLLPSERLRWSPIDAYTAKLAVEYEGLSLAYTVSFNEQDEIVRLETQRYMTSDRLERWVGKLSDYQCIHGVRIPTRIQATWKLPEGDHTYADFRVKEIAYNQPSNLMSLGAGTESERRVEGAETN